MRRIAYALLLSLVSLPLAAQTVTVTANNIVGVNQQPLGQGYLCFTPVNSSGAAQAFTSSGKQYYAKEQCWRVFAGVALGVVVADTSVTTPAVGYLPVIRDTSKNALQTYSAPFYPTSLSSSFDTWTPSTPPIALGSGLAALGTTAPTGLCTAPFFGYLNDGTIYFCGQDGHFHSDSASGGITSTLIATALGYTPVSPAALAAAIAAVPTVNNTNVNAAIGYTPVSPAALSAAVAAVTGPTSANIATALGYTPVSPATLAGAITSIPTVTGPNIATALGYTPASPADLSAFMPLAGGSLTGPLILAADPTAALQAATKQYVDAHGGGGSSSTQGFYVDNSSPSSCTVNAVSYTTPFDCAFATAKLWAVTGGQANATLRVGSNGVLTTNVGIQEPTAVNNHGTVNIIGSGVNSSIIQLNTSLGSGVCMFTQPPEATSLNYATVAVTGLTLDANNNADCIMSISGVKNGNIAHIVGKNVRAGSGHIGFQAGASAASTSTVFETFFDDVKLEGTGGGYNPAIISCTVSSGNPVCTITDPGSYPTGTFAVQVHGVGNGSGACSVYPTWTATGTTTLTGLTATGGTCVAPLYVSVTPAPKVDYNFLFGPGFTDSTVKDARAVESSAFAGFKVTGHPNTFVHLHCYVGQFACVEENGGGTYVGLESDSIGGFAAAIEGTGSTYTGTTQIYNNFQRYAGSSLFYVDQGTSAGTAIGFTDFGVSCNGNRQNQGGYHQLVVGTGLPYANTSTAGGSWEGGYAIPAGVHMDNTLDCSSSPTVNTVYPRIDSSTASGGATTPAPATPVFSVVGGTFTTAQTFTLSDITSGATIFYCANLTGNCTPNVSYSGAIVASGTETVCADAVAAAGGLVSATACNTYTINPVTPPPATGTGIGTIIAQGYETDGSLPFKTCYVGGSVCSGGVGSIVLSSTPTHTFGLNTPSAGTGISNSVGDFHLETSTPGASGTQFSMALWTPTGGGFGANASATNFYVGGWIKPVYPAGPSRIEMDAFAFDNNTDWMWGTQCNSDKMLIQTDNQAPSWVYTSMPCGKLYDGNFHHVEFTYHRTLAGDTSCSGMPCECWDTGSIDSVATAINVCKPATTATGWSGSGWQFQVDGAPTTASGGSPAKYDLYCDSCQFISGLAGTSGATSPGGGGSTTSGTGDLDTFNFDGGTTTPSGLTAVGSPAVVATQEHTSPNSAHFPSGLNYYTDSITPTKTVYTRQYVYLNTVNSSLSDTFLRFYHSGTLLWNYFFDTPTQHITYFDQATGASITAYSTAFPTGGWHYIETYTKIDPSVGHVTVKVDGTQVYDSGSFNTGTQTIDTVWFGNIGNTAPTGWDTYEDNVDFADNGFIGPI